MQCFLAIELRHILHGYLAVIISDLPILALQNLEDPKESPRNPEIWLKTDGKL